MSSTSSMHWRGPGHVATLPSPLCDGRHVSQCRRPPSDSAPPCSSEASTHHVGSGCPWQGLHYIYVDLCMFLSCSQHLLTRFHKYVLQSVLICMVAMLPTEPEAQSLAFSDSCATSSQSQEHPPNSKIPEPK